MQIVPSSPEAFRLMMEGTAAFADIEQNGMKIDVPYLDGALERSSILIKKMEDDLREDEVYKVWKKTFGEKADLGSRQQLGTVIFDKMGVPCVHRTKTGKPSTDEEAFEDVDFPFVKRYISLEKLKKARGTFLLGIRNEVDSDGYLHPFLNLHLATTFRSSSDSPNLQNQPVRDKRQAKMIRTAFIPRSPDHVLVERDYSSLEWRGAANFWKDPGMLSYSSDLKSDVHRDMGSEIYICSKDEVSKDARFYTKNGFVFPTLYGSYYVNCASNIWTQIRRAGITTKSGTPMFDHLAAKGITDPKQFENHMKKVEQGFNDRFPHWSIEKEKWWKLYLERGWFPLATGFVCQGVFSYNNLMNTPIQGPSFHLMLWSIIQINNWLKKNKMKSKIIIQIHDSILLDVYREEMQDVLEYTEQVMTQDVKKHWTWVVTPLAVETEWSETNWFEKKPLAV